MESFTEAARCLASCAWAVVEFCMFWCFEKSIFSEAPHFFVNLNQVKIEIELIQWHFNNI